MKQMSKDLFFDLQQQMANEFDNVENGNTSSLDVLLYMRNIKDMCEKTMEIAKEYEEQFAETIQKESAQYGNEYKNHEIKMVNGRKLYQFKQIEEVNHLEQMLKSTKDKYQNAFEGFQKGIVQTATDNDQLMWIDESGELKPFPELSFGKSYFTVKIKK